MRLADTGRASKAKHGDRFVFSPRRDATAQLHGNGFDGGVLPDHPRPDTRSKLLRVNRDQLAAPLLICLFERYFVGETIQNIHDEPRQIRATIQKDKQGNGGRSGDQNKRKRRRGMIDADQCEQHNEAAKPRIDSHHGITSSFSPGCRMRSVTGPDRVAKATVMPPPWPSFTPVTSIGWPTETGTATGVHALASVTCWVSP